MKGEGGELLAKGECILQITGLSLQNANVLAIRPEQHPERLPADEQRLPAQHHGR